MDGEFDDFSDLADMRLATLERQVRELAGQILHNQEKIKLMCGMVVGIYEDTEQAS